MIITLNFDSDFRKRYRNFLRIKRLSNKKVLKDISQNMNKYQARSNSITGHDKIKMSLDCDPYDLDVLKSEWKKNRVVEKSFQGDKKTVKVSFSEYLANYLYNYMWEHKDDKVPEEKGTGRVCSMYFSAADLNKLDMLRGEESVSEYIKKLIRSEYDTQKGVVLS